MSLMRSRTNRRIAGICGGIAQNQGWDANVIRLVWLAAILFAGTGVLAYVILWVVLPEEPIVLQHAPVYPSTQPYYPAASAPTYSPQPPVAASQPTTQG